MAARQTGGRGPAAPWLALGDSYTVGEGVAADDCWPLQLTRALHAAGVPIGGPRIVAATGWSTDELAAAIQSADPPLGQPLVSLAVGVNDQYRGRPVAAFDSGFAALLARAVELADGGTRRVFALTIPDWGVTPFARASGRDTTAIGRDIDACNARIAARCDAAAVAWVDVTAESRSAGASVAMLAADGLHPSAAAYARWTAHLLPTVRRLLADAA